MRTLNYAVLSVLMWLNIHSIDAADISSIANSSPQASSLNKEAYEKLKQGDYESSYRISKQALIFSKKEKNPIQLARSLSNIASNLSYLGENKQALELYNQSLEISTAENDLYGINRALNNIAGIYDYLEEREVVLKYRILQLENSLLSKDLEDQLIAYIGLTSVNSILGNIEQASIYNALAKTYIQKNPNAFLKIYVLFSESALFEAKNDYQSALRNMTEALSIAQKDNFDGLMVSSRANIADYLFLKGDYSEATKVALSALSDAEQLGFDSKAQQAHRLLSKIYQANKNFERALYHSQSANQLNITISGERVHSLAEITRIDRQVKETEARLEHYEQQQQILSLRLEKQKYDQLIWLISIGAIFVISFFIYYRKISNKEIARQKELNKQLEELDIVKDRVLTNTSHELRTPLNGIIGLSDIIIHDPDNGISDTTLDSIKLIKSSGEQLALVINDILQMSKLKNNKVTIINSQFKLAELVSDVISICLPLADKQNNTIEYKQETSDISITQDRGRLQQILFNVIGNAVKFTHHGKVEISTEVEENDLVIFISDTGIGIPEDNIKRIFKGFEQVDSSNSREQQGSGLGLAISRGLAEALGGSLNLHSTLGKGTQVQIVIPNGNHS